MKYKKSLVRIVSIALALGYTLHAFTFHADQSIVSQNKLSKTYKITFTFKHESELLTTNDFIRYGSEYNADFQAMMLNFTRAIHQTTKQYHFWDGFSLVANLDEQFRDRSFQIVMKGDHKLWKEDPIKREDPFRQYNPNEKTPMFSQIMQNVNGKNPFKVYLEILTKKKGQTICFTGDSGKTLLFIPKKQVTTIDDLSEEGSDDEITSFWKTLLTVLHHYQEGAEELRFNTGNTFPESFQSIAYMHGKLDYKHQRYQKRKVVAYDTLDGSNRLKVVFCKKKAKGFNSNPPPYLTIGVIALVGCLIYAKYQEEGSTSYEEER